MSYLEALPRVTQSYLEVLPRVTPVVVGLHGAADEPEGPPGEVAHHGHDGLGHVG